MSNVTTIDEVNSNVSRLTERVKKIEEKLDRLIDLVKRIESESNASPSVTRVYYDNQHDPRSQGEHY